MTYTETTAYAGCTGDAWGCWCQLSGDGGTGCVTDTQSVIWGNWHSDAGTTTDGCGSATSTVWYHWTEEFNAFAPVEVVRVHPTAAELRVGQEEARTREAERRKLIMEAQARRDAAEAMALDLLELFIGPEQRDIYKETGRLMVKGKDADYIIRKAGGVTRVEKDKLVDLCIHLKQRNKYPETDNVIAVALAVKDDEKAFNKMANEYHSQLETWNLPRCANGFGD